MGAEKQRTAIIEGRKEMNSADLEDWKPQPWTLSLTPDDVLGHRSASRVWLPNSRGALPNGRLVAKGER